MVVCVGVLCVHGFDQPVITVTHGAASLPGAVVANDVSRAAALAAGERLASAVFAGTARCLYAGAIGAGGSTAVGGSASGDRLSGELLHVVACPSSATELPTALCTTPAAFGDFVRSFSAASPTTAFCTLDALSGADIYEAAALAATAVSRLTWRGLASPLAVIDAQPEPDPRPDKWPLLLELVSANRAMLLRLLLDPVAASYSWPRPITPGSTSAAYLASWVGSMTTSGVPSYDFVPASLQGVGAENEFRLASYAYEPFSISHVTSSEPIDPPPAQVTAFEPASVAEILTPLSLLLVEAWLELQAHNLGALRDGTPPADRNVLVLHGLTWDVLNVQAVVDFGPCAVLMPAGDLVPAPYSRFVLPSGTLVIGQEGFFPEARGIVWDLRRVQAGGAIEPVNFREPASSDLDADFIDGVEAAGWWPDRELFSHLRWGAMFKTDMPLDIVLGPHMVSLGASDDSFANVDRELCRLAKKRYHNVHYGLPFLPMRAVPQGSTPRKYEPDRRRRTSNHSFPHFRDAIIDALGLRRVVHSLNSLVGLRDRQMGVECDCERRRGRWCNRCAKWLPEVKPRIQDKCRDDAILQHAATVWGERVVFACDDYADWYSQTPVAHSERWKSTVAWRADGWPEGWRPADVGAPHDAPYAVVEEQRLGFGCAASSCICQRFTDLILAETRRRFDAEEAEVLAAETCPRRLAWLAARAALSVSTGAEQVRLYAIHGYTDDISFSTVGAGRMLRLLRTWDEVCRDFGVGVAIPEKRQIGLSVTWLGVQFFSMGGFMVLPPPKRLRLLGLITELLETGTLAFSQYRAMTGMMESARLIVGLSPQDMYGLYGGAFRACCARPAGAVMAATDRMRGLLVSWRAHVAASAGALITSVFSAAPAPPPSQASFFLYSDAAGEGEAPGLGGYCHGAYWYMALSARALRMPIAVLEFVGIAVNVMVFGRRLAGADVALYSDSLTSVQVLNARARSDMTQFVHAAILELPELQALLSMGSLSINHVWGEGNVMSDAVSRQYMRLLREMAAQLGVALEELDVPARAWDFLERVVVEFERLCGAV